MVKRAPHGPRAQAARLLQLLGAVSCAPRGGRSSRRLPSAAATVEIDARSGLPIHTTNESGWSGNPAPALPAPKRTAPPPTAAGKNSDSTRTDLLRRAAELGIAGDLDDGEDPLSAVGESAPARRLRADVRASACETLNLGRLRTALDWADDFRAAMMRAPLSRPLRFEGDPTNMRYNQATLDSLAESTSAS